MGSEEEFLLDAVKKRRQFGKIFSQYGIDGGRFLLIFFGTLLAVDAVMVNESRQERKDGKCT